MAHHDIDESDDETPSKGMVSDPKFDRRRNRITNYRGDEKKFISNVDKIINIKSYLSDITQTEINSFLPRINPHGGSNTIICRGNIALSVPIQTPTLTPKFSRKSYVKLPPIKSNDEENNGS